MRKETQVTNRPRQICNWSKTRILWRMKTIRSSQSKSNKPNWMQICILFCMRPSATPVAAIHLWLRLEGMGKGSPARSRSPKRAIRGTDLFCFILHATVRHACCCDPRVMIDANLLHGDTEGRLAHLSGAGNGTKSPRKGAHVLLSVGVLHGHASRNLPDSGWRHAKCRHRQLLLGLLAMIKSRASTHSCSSRCCIPVFGNVWLHRTGEVSVIYKTLH